MLIFGILSIIQQVFLPGYLFLMLLRVKNLTPIQLFTYSFGLSLFLNYQIVLFLNYLDIYTNISLYFLIILEILAIIARKKDIITLRYGLKNLFLRLGEISNRWIFLTVVSILLFYTGLFLVNIGTIFYYFDASIGNHFYTDHMGFWYKYSLYWAQDMFPPQSYYFPQLWPANWSISHMLTGDMTVTLFNKVVMSIFPIGLLLLFLDLAIQKRRQIYLAGMIFISLMIPIFYSVLFIVDGNPELSVMFFTFLAFYYFNINQDTLFDWKTIIPLTIFTSSAALIKLSGFSIVFILFCWLLLMVIFDKKYELLFKLKSFAVFLLMLAFNLTWYIIKPMHSGLNQSGYFTGQTHLERFLTGVDLLASNFGMPFFIIIIVLFLLSILHKESRYISLLLVLPILGVYTAKYAYSIRNASITLPLLAFVIPFGLKVILGKYSFNKKGKDISRIFIAAAAVIILIMFSMPQVYEFLDSINLFLRARYFNFRRENLDLFLGYGKYYEVFINAVRAACVLVLILLLAEKIQIKPKFLFLFSIAVIILLNFTLLNDEKIINYQREAVKEIAVENLNHLIPRFETSSEVKVISNTRIEDALSTKITIDDNLGNDVNGSYDFIFYEKEKNTEYYFNNYVEIYDDLSYAIYIPE